eukprot:CAMPEP_0172317832 /NCGR_PEP_ID=MMETSP1058-20130122/32959_1 /TAXON_ID=83371 /ORGANISM="Detonula confervacea, Strain CCMP 353" /LENGTH=636 /DNA_ID=CAMNT_0013032483 /DNA_START=354 /DNA_END=2261 /DNA_ORIENTATION=-
MAQQSPPKHPTPPRTPPSKIIHGRNILGNSHNGGGGGSHTGSLNSRGSNNSNPRLSSSPEGRSADGKSNCGYQSVGSSERHPPSVGSIPISEDGAVQNNGSGAVERQEAQGGIGTTMTPCAVLAGDHGDNHAAAATGNNSSSLVRPSLAVDTTLPPTNTSTTTGNAATNIINPRNNNSPIILTNNPNTPTKGIPKNPKDTVAHISPGTLNGNGNNGGGIASNSPKRRVKSMGSGDLFGGNAFGGSNHGANAAFNGSNFAGSGGGSVGMVGQQYSSGVGGSNFAGSGGGSVGMIGAPMNRAGNAVGVKSVPTHANRGSGRPSTPNSPQSHLLNMGMNVMESTTPGSVDSLHSMKDIVTTSTRHVGHVSMPNVNGNRQNAPANNPSATYNSSNHKNSLDDEEQFMFEQRLTQDELGVAIRKISHSGKAQLRYVKCIPLRPPSSDDFEIGDAKLLNGSPGLLANTATNLAYLDTSPTLRSKPASDCISISSKSSTGSRFLERMRSTSSAARHGIRSINSIGKLHNSNIQEGSDNLLLNDKQDKSHRALTWGKKNAVTLSLDRFTCVRKGKSTERTMRNSSPSSRLLSIIVKSSGGTGSGGKSESLDIEAPTMLDRDKFASAFARFLGVPLLEEEVGGGG